MLEVERQKQRQTGESNKWKKIRETKKYCKKNKQQSKWGKHKDEWLKSGQSTWENSAIVDNVTHNTHWQRRASLLSMLMNHFRILHDHKLFPVRVLLYSCHSFIRYLYVFEIKNLLQCAQNSEYFNLMSDKNALMRWECHMCTNTFVSLESV